jgi:hypothetical protein
MHDFIQLHEDHTMGVETEGDIGDMLDDDEVYHTTEAGEDVDWGWSLFIAWNFSNFGATDTLLY